MTEIPEHITAAGWTVEDDGKAISKKFVFANFRAAMAWMVRAAFEAEALNHHPEWSNVYKTVDVRLTTHDSDGLTGLDFDLARRMEALDG